MAPNISITITTKNLKDIAKINKELSKLGPIGENANVRVKALNTGVGSLGNKIGFLAFQMTFLANVAGRSFDAIKDAMVDAVETGSKNLDSMTRAIYQSGVKIGDTSAENVKYMNLFRDAIADMGSGGTLFNIEEVANTVKEVGKATSDVSSVIPIATEALKLQTIEEVDAATAAKNLIVTMKTFGLTTADAGRAVDTLVAVNQQSTISLQDLVKSMGFASQQGKRFGLGMEDTAGYIGIIADRLGATAGRAGRNFAIFLQNMASTGTATNSVFKQMGINILDTQGNFRPLVDIIGEFRTALKAAGAQGDIMKSALIEEAKAGSQAERILLALTDATDDEVRAALAGAKTRGIADTLNEAFNKTPEAQIKKLKNAIDALKTAFTAGFAPALSEMAMALREIVNDKDIQEFFVQAGQIMSEMVIPAVKELVKHFKGFLKLLKENKGLMQPLVQGFVLLTAALGGLFILGTIGAVLTFVIGGLTNLFYALIGVSAATWATLGIVALFAAAIILVIKAAEEFKKPISEMNGVLIALAAAVAIIAVAFTAIRFGPVAAALLAGTLAATGLAVALSGTGESLEEVEARGGELTLGQTLEKAFKDAKKGIDDFVTNAQDFWGKITDAFPTTEEFLNPFTLVLAGLGDLLMNGGANAGQIFKDAFGEAFLNLGQFLFGRVNFEPIKALGEAIWNNLWYGVTQTWNNITSTLDEIIKLIEDGDWAGAGLRIGQAIWDAIWGLFFNQNPIADALGNIGALFGDTIGGLLSNGEGLLGSIFGGQGDSSPIQDLNDAAATGAELLTANNESLETIKDNFREEIRLFEEFKAGKSAANELQTTANTAVKEITPQVNKATDLYKALQPEQQKEIDSLKTQIPEIDNVTVKLPILGTWIDNMRDALKDVVDALRNLQNKINNTNIKFDRNDDGKVIGARLTGDGAQDIPRLASSFASGGIVTAPTNAIIGDTPGGEAVIPLNRLPALISQGLGSQGQSLSITVNPTIIIENAGNHSIEEILEEISERLGSEIASAAAQHLHTGD